MIGYFGDIIFETSDKRILTFSNFQRNINSNYEDHVLIGQKPQTEFIAPGLDDVSFTVILNGLYGVKPKKEMDRWLEKARRGVAETLCIGVPIGVDKWTVRSVGQIWEDIWNNGELISGKVQITLKEYCSVMWVVK